MKVKIILFIMTITLIIVVLLSKQIEFKTIRLGSSLPIHGINKQLGNEILEGINTHFKYINQKGGIQNKIIEFVYYDDKYEPQNTLINTKKLMLDKKLFALFSFVGTPTVKKILPIIDNIPFIAPYTGASFLRTSNKQNIINFRSSYKEEVENIVNYLYKFKNIKKFAIFYQNDDYGIDNYNALVDVLNKKNLKLIAEGTYKRNTLSIRHAFLEIKNKNPDAIILAGAYKPSAAFIKQARKYFANNIIFVPISFVNANALIKELNYNGKNIIFSQTVPSYNNKNLPIAKEYLKQLKNYYPKSEPSFASFEGFISAKIVSKALQNIKGNITQDKFLDNLKHFKPSNLGGIPIKYHNTQLLNKVYLLRYANNKFYPIEKDKN
jgi:ABC-type branched-subunit amino acid transport system substrate-binding protein